MMRPRPLCVAAALTAACGSGRAVTPPAPATPSPYSPAASQPAAPPTSPARPHVDAVHYGPSAVRYLVHRQLHIQQALGDQTQVQDLGVRIFVAVAITGPADAVGYPTTFSVDSMVADSGTPPRVADTLVKVLQPHGVAVHLSATHLCTQMRGVKEDSSKTWTSFWRGSYEDEPSMRQEFLQTLRFSRR